MTAVEVAPGVLRVEDVVDGRVCAVHALAHGAGWILVDTGVASTPARCIAPQLAARGIAGDDVTHVVVTHADVDHSGGLGAVQRWAPRAQTLCGAADRTLVEDVERLVDERYRELRHDHLLDQTDDFVGWVRASADDGTVDRLVEGPAALDGVDRALRILPAPGHTAGHVVVLDERERIAVIGDAALGAAAVDRDGQPAFAPTYRDVGAYRATLDRLAALDCAVMLAAHEPPMDGAAARAYLAASRDAVTRMEAAVLAAVPARGTATTAAVLAAVADAVRSWPRAADGTLAQPVVGHLEDLEARGVVRRRADAPPASWQRVRRARCYSIAP